MHEGIPTIRVDVPSNLDSIVLKICSLKVQMDHRFSLDSIFGQAFVDDWMGSHNSTAYWGSSFLSAILPFTNWYDDFASAQYRAYVDPCYVLGASIGGLPRNIEPKNIEKRITEYSGFNGPLSEASYLWYKPLGLMVAHEGKHRVAFMRAHDQPLVAAWVRERSYPAPDRITIIEGRDDRDQSLCLLDGRYVQVMQRPRVGQLLLQAYGVRSQRWNQIAGLPDEQKVRQRIRALKLDLPPKTTDEAARTFDLQAFRSELDAKAHEDSVEILASSWNLGLWRVKRKPFFGYLAGFAAAGACVARLPFAHCESLGAAFMGVAFGIGFSSVVRWFATSKRVSSQRRELG